MKDQKKAKWILGSAGVMLSALMLTQFNDGTTETNATDMEEVGVALQPGEKLTEREQELVSLDWTNFEIVSMNPQKTMVQSNRKTRKS
ncbi:hypothetical protein SAMN05880501_11425 [Ureibacillus xyleni]|uniref:Uncharacterized protein n=1 Tax=Ureibacillus xyleni TaxID=614648 RepID=A0A285TJD2_9BACL|nr:hypothetical protein [Ureibacillus xyleni]SOC22455.1 hypothetical protein SAMN05880501_11425 [Ureibacillus xyleni]